jgi:hypothetical protein
LFCGKHFVAKQGMNALPIMNGFDDIRNIFYNKYMRQF